MKLWTAAGLAAHAKSLNIYGLSSVCIKFWTAQQQLWIIMNNHKSLRQIILSCLFKHGRGHYKIKHYEDIPD